MRIASATQEVSALPARAPVSQIAQATGSEASLLILQADVDAQTGSPMTTGVQAPSTAAAAAPNVKDQSFGPSTISKAMVHEATRLRDDAAGWARKLQELELDLKKNQDVEAKGKDIDECLVVLRTAARRNHLIASLAPRHGYKAAQFEDAFARFLPPRAEHPNTQAWGGEKE